MDQLWPVLYFVFQNWQAIVATIVGVIGFVSRRVSASRAEALKHVAEVIEGLDVTEVKEAVAAKAASMRPAAAAALNDAVNTVDPKKPTPAPGAAFLRELLRLVAPKKA